MSNIVKNFLKKIIPLQLRMGLRAGFARMKKRQEELWVYWGLTPRLQKSVPQRFKVGMAVLCHERADYLEICLDTLFHTNLHDYDVTFLLIDDGSTDPRVREIIELPRDPKYNIHRVFTPKGHDSWGAAFNKAIRHLGEMGDYDILGTCDSDALFHPEWLDQTLKIALWAKAHHRRHVLGPFSSFNSSDADFHRIQGTYEAPTGNYVVKKRMGALNYFYFRQDLEKLGMFAEHKDDETLMTERFEAMKVYNFCTETSWVEHIGELSVLNQWRPTPVARAVFGLNLSPSGWPSSLEETCTFGYLRFVQRSKTYAVTTSSRLPVEVIFVATNKDLPTLGLAIDAVRKNLRHPVSAMRIIAPESEQMRQISDAKGCVFVEENSVLPLKRADIRYMHQSMDRSGWMFQQFLKLGADSLCEQRHYYVIDADTILVSPQTFEYQDKLLVLHSDEYHRPYFEINRCLMQSVETTLFSCVAHQMLFSVERLRALRDSLETLHRKPWYQSILDQLDRTEMSGFSEFELYGHWSLRHYGNDTLREYWKNLSLPRSELSSLPELESRFGSSYRSVSFHSYIGQ